MNPWIVFYTTLSAVVLCTQLYALILLKRDHNFRANQKYLIGALCCTEIALLIQFIMRSSRFMNRNVGAKLIVHFGDAAAGFTYLFVMTIITLDRFAEIKLNLKYRLYCNTKKTITTLFLAFSISCIFYVGLLINFFINGNKPDWDKLLIVYFIPLFQGIFLVIAFMTYSYIFKKLRKNQLALNKIRNQLNQSSSRKRSPRKIQSKPMITVPSLIILTFILFSILPNFIFAAVYHWSTIYRHTVASKLFPCLYFLGWVADPAIYIFSVKSIRQIMRRFTRFLKQLKT